MNSNAVRAVIGDGVNQGLNDLQAGATSLFWAEQIVSDLHDEMLAQIRNILYSDAHARQPDRAVVRSLMNIIKKLQQLQLLQNISEIS